MTFMKTFPMVFALMWAITACDSGGREPPPPPPEATFEGLGDLPGDVFRSDASGVSGDGSVVVGRSWASTGVEAFRWEGGVMTGLGDLPGGTFISFTTATSADGSVVVGASESTASNGNYEAFRWVADPAGGENGTMTGLGDFPGSVFFSRARGISADGSVVVGEGDSANGTEAFRWENGTMTGLGDLPGGAFHSIAQGVSADGLVVIGQGNSANGPEAFRWEGGTMTGLGDLPGGNFSSIARSVSGDGNVIVGIATPGSPQQAFIWTPSEGMRNLKAVLASEYNLDLTGWTLNDALSVSDDGDVIVGFGTNPDGDVEAWRAFLGAPIGSSE